jgi:hypothetical protein
MRENQTFKYITKDLRVSVLQFSPELFELAVQYRPYPLQEPENWDIDYSIYNDVIAAKSPMEVYGLVEGIKESYLS